MARRHGSAPHRLAVRGPSWIGLRKIDVFKGLDLRMLREIAHRCTWTRYKRNEYVLRRSASNRDVHFVIAGILRVTAEAGHGRRIVFRDVPAGDLFGENAAIDGQPHSADVVCARESLVASMSSEAFRALLSHQVTIRERVLRRLTRSVRDLAGRIVDLRAMPVSSRICGELLRLAQQMRVGQDVSTIDPLPTHEEIASRVGTSREEVTRELSRLEREGLIQRAGRSLHLRQITEFERLAKGSFGSRDPLDEVTSADLQVSPNPAQCQRRALLVAEAQGSVRMLEIDERRTVELWNAYLARVTSETIPAHEGRGFSDAVELRFVADFPDGLRALGCAFELHQAFSGFDGQNRLFRQGLRVGLHLADVMVEPFHVAGDGVQVAAGLAELANSGETVISVQVRDQLTSGLDASIEDLGEQRLRNRQRPVRVFRVWPLSKSARAAPYRPIRPHGRPSLAVVPFGLRSTDPRLQFIGDGLAEETIASLSRMPDFFVVSRLSSMAFGRAPLTVRSVGEILGVQYVLSGSLQTVSGHARLLAELADAREGEILWSNRFECGIGDILAMQEELVRLVVKSVAPFIRTLELRRARQLNSEQLDAYTTMLLGVDLMHRMSWDEFMSARSALEKAVERDPVFAGPHAWLAKWHILRIATGASENLIEDRQAAIRCAERALACDPQDALALAVDALVCGWSRSDLDGAQRRLAQALASNPNEPLAWLWNGIVHAWRGNGDEAVDSTDRALSLSPLDPMLYYFHSLASTANLVAGRYERAIDYAERSVRDNCLHTPSLRTLAAAQVLMGRVSQARATMRRLRTLEPELTASSFKVRYPGRDSPQTRIFIAALRTAGLPR